MTNLYSQLSQFITKFAKTERLGRHHGGVEGGGRWNEDKKTKTSVFTQKSNIISFFHVLNK